MSSRLEDQATRGIGAFDAPGLPQLTLLGGFSLTCSGVHVGLPLSAQRLLAFLALHDRPLLRTYTAGCLWSDATEEHSVGSLRSALWRVRKPGHGLIDGDSTWLQLAPGVSVDVHHMTASAHCLIDESIDPAAPELDTLLCSDLLPDWYDEWVIMARERLRQLRLHALEALAERLAVARNFGRAIEACLLAIEGEPLRESAHRILVGIHLAEGNRHEALRHFNHYRDLMKEGLGLAPSTEMVELIGGLTPG